jgi:PleD family two-component response regulator
MNRFYNFFRKNSPPAGNICRSEEEFHKKLEIECKRLAYNEQAFSLILLKMNSTQTGPEKIQKLIKKIHYRIRDIDIIGRYDTESIGVIMPYTSENGARGLLQKIMASIMELKKDTEYTVYRYFPDKDNPEKIQREQL